MPIIITDYPSQDQLLDIACKLKTKNEEIKDVLNNLRIITSEMQNTKIRNRRMYYDLLHRLSNVNKYLEELDELSVFLEHLWRDLQSD